MNRRVVYLLAGVVLVVVVVVYWFVLLNPLMNDITDTNAQIEQSEQTLSGLKVRLAQSEQTRREAGMNQGRLIELAKMVPAGEELPSLLLQIQDLATESGIDFMSISPGQSSPSPGFQVIPLQLQFTGYYFDLNDFIYRAEQLAAGPGRLLGVQSLQLALSGEQVGRSSPELEITMTMNAYQRNPALEPAPPAAAPTETQPVQEQ